MGKLTPQEINQFQTKILTWFSKNKRDLPWRQTRDPYHILVSEVMLQQTQVSRVLPKYHLWFKTFPTIGSLAQAKTSEVLRLWSGLGYNRRALYLLQTAKILNNHYKQYNNYNYYIDEKALRSLLGIGEYTARAVLCFAFDKQVAVVDTNVKRVILTQIQSSKLKDQSSNKKEIQEIADKLLPKGKAYEWNQALMDYAAAMLRKEKIPIPKQSRFMGSDRYYRGKIVKLLLAKERVSISEVENLFKKSTEEKNRARKIIQSLVKDGIIKASDKYLVF